MEVFPTHLDRKFVKIIKIITVFGFPILGPILALFWALFALWGHVELTRHFQMCVPMCLYRKHFLEGGAM